LIPRPKWLLLQGVRQVIPLAGKNEEPHMLEPKPKEEGGDGVSGTSAAKTTKTSGKKPAKKK
jgi:hypothetical protein